jgi:glycolate oxidase iron-sulfur subunit
MTLSAEQPADAAATPAQPPCQTSGDRPLIDACVHCGFCLTSCPSYRVLGSEMDSPRGRIYLMKALDEGEIELNATTVSHFDTCLGCFACVTACPSGVQYDSLIEHTRNRIQAEVERPWPQRLFRQALFQLLPYPQRLRWLLRPLQVYQQSGLQGFVQRTGLTKLLGPQLSAMERLLPPLSAESFRDGLPQVIAAKGERRYRVGLILGCVQRVFNPDVNAATVEVLTANGCEVVIPPSQGCCGAVTHHQGKPSQTQALARALIDCFAEHNLDAILVTASGCGHSLKLYDEILQDDAAYRTAAEQFAAKVKDVQEFLAEVGLTAPLSPLAEQKLTVVYQDACHMLHGQRLQAQPRQLLRQIPGVELRDPLDPGLCCGSAGVYNLLQPQVAAELGRQKVENLTAPKPDLIVSANIGCSLQIRQHLDLQGKAVPVYHPMQLLAASLRCDRPLEAQPVSSLASP